jgi:hypothetical protein
MKPLLKTKIQDATNHIGLAPRVQLGTGELKRRFSRFDS